jgi:outer membrane biogenesis lipoprotein LolB
MKHRTRKTLSQAALLLVMTAYLTGCPHQTQIQTDSAQLNLNHYQMQAKIGYITETGGGSAYLTWKQDKHLFNGMLHGPLGSYKTKFSKTNVATYTITQDEKTYLLNSEQFQSLFQQQGIWLPHPNLLPSILVADVQGFEPTPNKPNSYELPNLEDPSQSLRIEYQFEHPVYDQLPTRIKISQGPNKLNLSIKSWDFESNTLKF